MYLFFYPYPYTPPNEKGLGTPLTMGGSGNNNCRVYVGNLPPDIRSKDIEDIFHKYGKIEDMDPKFRRGFGPPYAFVEFRDRRYNKMQSSQVRLNSKRKKFWFENKNSKIHPTWFCCHVVW